MTGRSATMKFVNLPYYRQLKIAKRMGLLSEEEMVKLPAHAIGVKLFQRSRDANKIDQLITEINAEATDYERSTQIRQKT